MNIGCLKKIEKKEEMKKKELNKKDRPLSRAGPNCPDVGPTKLKRSRPLQLHRPTAHLLLLAAPAWLLREASSLAAALYPPLLRRAIR